MADAVTSTVVSITNLTKRFGHRTVFKALSLEIARGQVFALLGPSGCGKSSLLNILAGVDQRFTGDVKIGGKPPLVYARSETVSFLAQSHTLLPWLSVEQNVLLPIAVQRRPNSSEILRARKLLTNLELESWRDSRPPELSGGMRQRVALAQAFVEEPRLVLFDEPFSSLDDLLRRRLMMHVRQLGVERPMTAVWVTHSVDEAVVLADRIALWTYDGRNPASIKEIVAGRRTDDAALSGPTGGLSGDARTRCEEVLALYADLNADENSINAACVSSTWHPGA